MIYGIDRFLLDSCVSNDDAIEPISKNIQVLLAVFPGAAGFCTDHNAIAGHREPALGKTLRTRPNESAYLLPGCSAFAPLLALPETPIFI